jgi:hypothetical protein
MLSHLSQLQKEIIHWIIAINEEIEPPTGKGAQIMQAFQGGFIRGMPYTCYVPVANKVLLYVYEEGANFAAGPRATFNKKCEPIKKALLEAACFINEQLIVENYVRVIEKPETERFKEDVHGPFWRRFETFFPHEIGSLKFVCTHLFIPKMKLIAIGQQVPIFS